MMRGVQDVQDMPGVVATYAPPDLAAEHADTLGYYQQLR